jgi:hypothetical protein
MKKLLPLLAALASATPLLAQTPAPAGPDMPQSTSLLDAIIHAGPIIIPLVVLSIFSVMLVVVYFLTIRRGAVVSSGYMATADALLRKRDYLGLLAVSNRHGESIARVVQKMLEFTTKNPGADFAQVREIAETEGTRVASNINNKVTYLPISACSRRSSDCSAPSSVSCGRSARSAQMSAPPVTHSCRKASARRSSTPRVVSRSASPRSSFTPSSAAARSA